MCRLLYVKSNNEFETKYHLEKFAEVSRNSREYQGHGWGCAYRTEAGWKHYRNISPIWEDDLSRFGKAKYLIAHARSAFQDKDIFVENNMPFYDDRYIFVFNGELRGVRINSEGRIGAEKIFNYIKRFDKGDILAALKRAMPIIRKKTEYIRAMNIMIAEDSRVFVTSLFNEDQEYFTMYYKTNNGTLVICSDPYASEENWMKIENNYTGVFQ